MADLTIQISGDLKNYEDALSAAQEKTSALNDKLSDLASIAGIAFAALTAEQGLAVAAFAESQKATNELTQALQNQGIYSDELMQSYKQQGEELQKLTGIDNDAIAKSQALLQGMIGQQEITPELTKAILDLSVAKGMDLNSTTELIGKGIEGHTMALDKLGIHIDQHLDKEERTARIIEIVNTKFGDQAEAANQGLGGIKGLHAAFDDLQKQLGERFAPKVEFIIETLTSLFQTIAEHEEIANFAFSVISAATVVAGLGVAVGLAGMAWLKYQAAMEVAGLATESMSIATKGLVGATGIGLILVVASELYLHWGTVWPKMQEIFQVFVDNISTLSGAVGKILQGVFKFDRAKISEGMAEVSDVVSEGYDDVTAIITKKGEEQIKVQKQQNEEKAEAAQEAQDRADQLAEYKQEQLDAEIELEKLKLEDASKEYIDIKTAEIETLKQLQDSKNETLKVSLTKHLADMRQIEAGAIATQNASRKLAIAQILADNKSFQSLSTAEQQAFLQKNQANLQNSLETEKTIKATYALQETQADIKKRNQYLMDEQQFGAAYAYINSQMHSTVFQSTQSATSDLVGLANSKNSTLKAIGKAASVTQIAIQTATAAMNVAASFSAIPFIGWALGLAAAAAVIAYGGERIGDVLSAAQGGLVTGGMAGIDSVPAMLMPGELVVPKHNFEEVVSSVRTTRATPSDDYTASGEPSAGVVQTQTHVTIGFDTRTASQLLTILQIEDNALGISPKGTGTTL